MSKRVDKILDLKSVQVMQKLELSHELNFLFSLLYLQFGKDSVVIDISKSSELTISYASDSGSSWLVIDESQFSEAVAGLQLGYFYKPLIIFESFNLVKIFLLL